MRELGARRWKNSGAGGTRLLRNLAWEALGTALHRTLDLTYKPSSESIDEQQMIIWILY